MLVTRKNRFYSGKSPEDIAMKLPKLANAHDGTDPVISGSSPLSLSLSIASADDARSLLLFDNDEGVVDGSFLHVGQPAVKHSLYECDPDNQRSIQPTWNE